MTASERVELMREIKAEAKARRREAHFKAAMHVLIILLPLIIFGCLFVSGFDDAEAFAAGSKPSAISHGGLKDFEEPEQPMFTEGEAMELMRVARAEAGNQGPEGQALVICVILNRVNDGRFGSTIHDVITAPSQFSTVSSGSWLQEPNADSFEALEMVRNGWDESQGALYFRATWSGHFSWAEYLFTYGGHNFYR